MRLLNTETLELEFFVDDTAPEYAILSHTWATEEILYDDVIHGFERIPKSKKGFAKVRDCCAKAASEGYRHVWIDTCCIDKSSSAELSEAINSMFQWYEGSAICYAYLCDVDATSGESPDEMIKGSRWTKRGWTLQELIAPHEVEFFDKNWISLGDRGPMADEISLFTGIGPNLLCRTYDQNPGIQELLASCSVASKMSWAANRQTTRREDRAYSLLGLFDISMPLLYGEGDKAFIRLQEEIIKSTNDHSILAFSSIRPGNVTSLRAANLLETSYLAADVKAFEHSGDIKLGPSSGVRNHDMMVTSRGIKMDVCVCPATLSYSESRPRPCYLAILECSLTEDFIDRPAIVLESLSAALGTFCRIEGLPLFQIRHGFTDSVTAVVFATEGRYDKYEGRWAIVDGSEHSSLFNISYTPVFLGPTWRYPPNFSCLLSPLELRRFAPRISQVHTYTQEP